MKVDSILDIASKDGMCIYGTADLASEVKEALGAFNESATLAKDLLKECGINVEDHDGSEDY